MTQRLVSFDPGGTTGCAILVQADDGFWDIVETCAAPTDDDVIRIIQPGDIVIYEFIKVFDHHINTIGIEVIGAIKTICKMRGIKPIQRSPGYLQGIRHWPIKIAWKTKGPHQKDALHHAIVYLGYQNVRGVTMHGTTNETHS